MSISQIKLRVKKKSFILLNDFLYSCYFFLYFKKLKTDNKEQLSLFNGFILIFFK